MAQKFKAIASQRYADGTYSEVGMTDRTIFTGSRRTIHRNALAWAGTHPVRVEYFMPERFYGEPFNVEYLNSHNPWNGALR